VLRSLPRDLEKQEEFGGQDDANRMQAEVLGAGIAASVAIEAGQGMGGAGLQHAPQDVYGRGATVGAALLGRLIEHGLTLTLGN
jgi:hypothetical protein